MTLLKDRTDAPERSLRQRMDALGNANRIRSVRAEVKKDLHRGRLKVSTAISWLEEPPAEFETMKVFALLLAMPKIGRVKANKILQQQRISASKTLGGLSERQRGELVLALRGWALP